MHASITDKWSFDQFTIKWLSCIAFIFGCNVYYCCKGHSLQCIIKHYSTHACGGNNINRTICRVWTNEMWQNLQHVHECMHDNEMNSFRYFVIVAQDWHFHCNLLFVVNRAGMEKKAVRYHSSHEEHYSIMGVPSSIMWQIQ